jgi:hypothetical protein
MPEITHKQIRNVTRAIKRGSRVAFTTNWNKTQKLVFRISLIFFGLSCIDLDAGFAIVPAN